MVKKMYKKIFVLFMTLTIFCCSSISTLTTSAAWYQHSTPLTITTTPVRTSSRIYDGSYMAIEITVNPLPSNATYPAGLIIEPVIDGVGGTKLHVDFTQNTHCKLDYIPINGYSSVYFRYQVFGTGVSSITISNIVSYSW